MDDEAMIALRSAMREWFDAWDLWRVEKGLAEREDQDQAKWVAFAERTKRGMEDKRQVVSAALAKLGWVEAQLTRFADGRSAWTGQ